MVCLPVCEVSLTAWYVKYKEGREHEQRHTMPCFGQCVLPVFACGWRLPDFGIIEDIHGIIEDIHVSKMSKVMGLLNKIPYTGICFTKSA